MEFGSINQSGMAENDKALPAIRVFSYCYIASKDSRGLHLADYAISTISPALILSQVVLLQ